MTGPKSPEPLEPRGRRGCNCVNVNGFIRTFFRKNIFVLDIFVKVYLGIKTSPKTMFHSMGGVVGEWEKIFGNHVLIYSESDLFHKVDMNIVRGGKKVKTF